MKHLALILLSIAWSGNCVGQAIPERAIELMPVLNTVIDDFWPNLQMRSYIPAQIEQETCITLKHRFCWNPRAELKTDREYGFGLGQTTVAFRKDGSERFNVWRELRSGNKELKDWTWENRFSPIMQLRAIVIKNKTRYDTQSYAVAAGHRFAFLASEYNGGSTLKDRALCRTIKGCDSTRWWDNVELYSVKSKVPAPGYRKSFFDINREYVVNVLMVRRQKYVPYTGE